MSPMNLMVHITSEILATDRALVSKHSMDTKLENCDYNITIAHTYIYHLPTGDRNTNQSTNIVAHSLATIR
jgi:hypothetical protein